jgi:hypothetical protein
MTRRLGLTRPTGAKLAALRNALRASRQRLRRPGHGGSGRRKITVQYRPEVDGLPDPGEIVWAWVPYEEDASQGKDRPVLVVAEQDDELIAIMLTSKDHDRHAAREAEYGRLWLDIGSGDWDPKRRPSEVRLDRILRLDPATVRREGAALDRERFVGVTRLLQELHGWS